MQQTFYHDSLRTQIFYSDTLSALKRFGLHIGFKHPLWVEEYEYQRFTSRGSKDRAEKDYG